MIYIIVAMDKNLLIGNKNQLPWRIKEELQFFKSQTIKQTILMGRKTFESIQAKLVDRKIIVLTKNPDFQVDNPDVRIIHDIDDVLNEFSDSKKKLYICGGSQIYSLFWQHVDEVIVSEVIGDYLGDVYFPKLSWSNLKLDHIEKHKEFNVKTYIKK